MDAQRLLVGRRASGCVPTRSMGTIRGYVQLPSAAEFAFDSLQHHPVGFVRAIFQANTETVAMPSNLISRNVLKNASQSTSP